MLFVYHFPRFLVKVYRVGYGLGLHFQTVLGSTKYVVEYAFLCKVKGSGKTSSLLLVN